MTRPFDMMRDMYDSLSNNYNMIVSWLKKEHPEVLAQFAQYLEEEE